MLGIPGLLLHRLALLEKSRRQPEAEILVLRHQVNILRRRTLRRLRLSNADRLAFVWLYRLCPSVVGAVAIIKPETLIRWHRCGFKAFWRWKSRSRGGRPAIPREIRETSRSNWLCGASRIHGELLKLGIEVAQSTVAKYMIRRPRRPGQSWATFLRNHADGIAAVDLFVVPTIGFSCSMAWSSWTTADGGSSTMRQQRTRPRSGLPGRLSRDFPGIRHPPVSCETVTPSMARS